MIKRRFYRTERGDRDDASSDSSSSSSDSDLEAETSQDSEPVQPQPQPESPSDVDADDAEEDDNHDNGDDELPASLNPQLPSSSSSGYESEDSSANEIDADSTELFTNDDEGGTARGGEPFSNSLFPRGENGIILETWAKGHPETDDIPSYVLKSKSVFKCKLCPKIVCLNEESLRAHLKSKRHARSEKLLNDGRLKRVLNSDGEEVVVAEDDGETHAERHARIVALAQELPKNKGKGRQRQRERLKRKKQKNSSEIPNSGQKTENRAKRRRKNAEKL